MFTHESECSETDTSCSTTIAWLDDNRKPAKPPKIWVIIRPTWRSRKKKSQGTEKEGLLRSRWLRRGQWTVQITCGVKHYFYESHSLETVLVSWAFPGSCTILPCFLCHKWHSWQESTVRRRTWLYRVLRWTLHLFTCTSSSLFFSSTKRQ